MPIKRENANFPALHTAVELLTYLQRSGHLDGVEVPDWATGGTSFEELMNTLEYLGDGEWLSGAYPNCGSAEAADQWLFQFLNGRPVPDREDVRAHRKDIEHGKVEESEDIVLKDDSPPKQKAARQGAGAAKNPASKIAKPPGKKAGARK